MVHRRRSPRGAACSRFAGSLVLLLAVTCVGGQRDSLEEVEASIDRRYDVEERTTEELAAALREGSGDLLLVDVRSREEYAVSHLEGALRVEPGLAADDFVKRFAAAFSGKDLVFYCSVGERSSRFAERVEEAAREAGARRVQNLRGGVFRWRNEDRALIDSGGPTTRVHPYSERWGRLLDDPRAVPEELRVD